ncbi:hypothetical protein FPQ18DRAFT_69045 [Pyronema domesticum]|nr:hypothetical protein FPQ18DRAFT_69045 [Pyronema domesticum]
MAVFFLFSFFYAASFFCLLCLLRFTTTYLRLVFEGCKCIFISHHSRLCVFFFYRLFLLVYESWSAYARVCLCFVAVMLFHLCC